MSEYTKRLHRFVNSKAFVRSFYGKCPNCGKSVFSIGDEVTKDCTAIKAKFVCTCGEKWKETVYSRDRKKYKYRQALVKDYHDPKKGDIKVLDMGKRLFLVTPDKILSKTIK